MEKFLAKTNPRETLEEHTANLIIQYKTLKNIYEEKINSRILNWELLYLACLYHDMGKINIKFQNKLRKNLELKKLPEGNLEKLDEINHNFLGPAFIPKEALEKFNKNEIKLIYQSIYRHHRRNQPKETLLRNFIKNIEFDKNDFNKNNMPELKDLKLDNKLNDKYYEDVRLFINEYFENKLEAKEMLNKYILTKGLLNKIDYAASSYIVDGHLDIEKEPEDIKLKTIDFFNRENEKEGFNKYKINELQQYMMDNQEKNNIVIAATGFGKTEAALMWIGKNKGFFTLPLKVSINAIYDRVVLNIISKDKVGLLHSDTYSEYLKRTNKDENNEIKFDERYYEETKSLSMPLTICTLDQLIDFVFQYDGFEMKLATLSYSKIIIDEIQMYSPGYLACLLMALKMITDLGGKFSILTATLPPILIKYMDCLDIPFNACKTEYFNNTLRHRVKVLEENININQLKVNFKSDKKILIICNTIKKAQEVYDEIIKNEMFEGVNINLLHSRFIKRDRKIKEDDIKEMGKKETNEYGIWVTTQIVEASLDIDFDELYTELSEVNGLFQRMGRVYRSRVLDHNGFNVFVYVGKDKEYPSLVYNDKISYAIDFSIFMDSKEILLMNQSKGIVNYFENIKMDIVKDIYSYEKLSKDKKSKDGYKSRLEETLSCLIDLNPYELEKGEVKLREISQIVFIPLEVYEKEKNEIKEIENNLKELYKSEENFRNKSNYDKNEYMKLKNKNKPRKQQLRDKLLEYTTSIDAKRFENNGLLYSEIEITEYEKYPIGNVKYSFEKGVILEKYFNK